MRFLLFIFIIVSICACSNNKALQDKLEILYSRPVLFPDSGMIRVDSQPNKYCNADTLMPEYKLIVFVGPKECSTCAIKSMSEWNTFLNIEREGKIQLTFIINPSKLKLNDIVSSYRTSGLEHSIYIDTCGIFLQQNPHIPESSTFHVLLLDKKDSVLLVGNPIHNEKIQTLLYERINLKKEE